jgi:uncharacterized protein with FMN-binding domain
VRRAVFAILGTAAATSVLVAVKANVDTQLPVSAQAPPAPDGGSAPPPAGAAAGPGGAATGPGGASAPPASNGAAPPAPVAPDGQIDGRRVNTPYGPVVVTIILSGGRITDIDALVPSTGESADIGPPAARKLRQQALARQSAKIDTVSGATYTSEAYKESLQSAIDKAKRG